MLVLIDESGDAGFKFDKGSTKFFVLSAVIFDDNLDAEKTALDIKLLKRELKLSELFEFHFNGCSPKYKTAFFKQVASEDFRIRSLVIEKSLIKSPKLRQQKSAFYNYAVKLLLKDAKGNIKNASVKIDGQGDRTYKQAAQNYLKRELNTPSNKVIEKLKLVDSRKDVLIQLADMVCGAIARSYNNETQDADSYQKLINKRIENIWYFR